MPYSTIGDLRQHLQNLQTSNRVKTDLNTLVQELTTGEKSDLTAHLGAGQTILDGIDRQIDLIGQFKRTNTETSQMLSTMQIAMDAVEGQRMAVSNMMTQISGSSPEAETDRASAAALHGFNTTIQSLNTRFGDRALFGGVETSSSPLAGAEVMLGALRAAVSGLTDVDDITAAVDDWFDEPGGGFETVGYLGSSAGSITRPVSPDHAVTIDARADDVGVRDVLKSFAKGVLASDAALGLAQDDRRSVLHNAGIDLLTSAIPLTNLQAGLGYAEAEVAERNTRLAAQATSYSMTRNDLVSADPFETASKLDAVQAQLETHYTLTARLSRLSLTEYLR